MRTGSDQGSVQASSQCPAAAEGRWPGEKMKTMAQSLTLPLAIPQLPIIQSPGAAGARWAVFALNHIHWTSHNVLSLPLEPWKHSASRSFSPRHSMRTHPLQPLLRGVGSNWILSRQIFQLGLFNHHSLHF